MKEDVVITKRIIHSGNSKAFIIPSDFITQGLIEPGKLYRATFTKVNEKGERIE